MTHEAVTLAARDVKKTFGGVIALKGVSSNVAEGMIVGLIGPNGAGKSTLLGVLSGFVRPDAGLVRTFQEAAPIPGLSVLDNVRVGMHTRFHGGPLAALLRLPGMRRQETERRQEARELLAQVGLAELELADAGRLTFASCACWRSPAPWPPRRA